MSAGELDRAYRDCRRIAAAHGRTYFLATRLLEPGRRPAIHALYAFARTVDDIVDAADAPERAEFSAAQLDRIERELRDRLARRTSAATPSSPAGETGIDEADRPVRDAADDTARAARLGADDSAHRVRFNADNAAHLVRVGADDAAHPVRVGADDTTRPARVGFDDTDRVLLAVADTVARYSIAAEHFWVFLDSMRMDVPGSPLFRASYPDMAALREYMRGSAAAIGLQLLPILGTVGPRAEAEPAAAALGEAFQLTNFLRDVAEDLDRGRIYLPADELAAFGVDPELLRDCRRRGRTDPRVRRALANLIAANRALYRTATPGIDLLLPRVRPAIRTAATLYAGILDEIEHTDYEIFTHRAVVPRHRRFRVAAKEFATAHPFRRPHTQSA
ncbi:phytoene/squalene synthase family protein [Nocardia sp. NPDC050406]|uniref:phytoene/squalene synthase family protein n=1 Tax=Nocardia sp. NPDC050406 TaxID=3364318 RepID=UPI003791B6AA